MSDRIPYEKLIVICRCLGRMHTRKNVGKYKDKKLIIDLRLRQINIYVRFSRFSKKLVYRSVVRNRESILICCLEGRWPQYIDKLYTLAKHQSQYADDQEVFPDLT